MPSLSRKLLSYLRPFEIKKASTKYNPRLELIYHEGRYMLSTGDAIYSEGIKYRPLVAAFGSRKLKPKLKGLQNVLVLGTGLASAAHLLHHHGLTPIISLVEIDAIVLQWAMEYLPKTLVDKTKPIRDDAFVFMENNRDSYDLIIVDIFFGLETAEGVLEKDFLEKCQQRLSREGILVLNTMFKSRLGADAAKPRLETVFSDVEEIRFGQNSVYIC